MRGGIALAAGAQSSPVGRAKTLPGGSVAQARLAVFSCANYPTGCFHADADTAKREDLDVVILLDDYLDECGPGGYMPATVPPCLLACTACSGLPSRPC